MAAAHMVEPFDCSVAPPRYATCAIVRCSRELSKIVHFDAALTRAYESVRLLSGIGFALAGQTDLPQSIVALAAFPLGSIDARDTSTGQIGRLPQVPLACCSRRSRHVIKFAALVLVAQMRDCLNLTSKPSICRCAGGWKPQAAGRTCLLSRANDTYFPISER